MNKRLIWIIALMVLLISSFVTADYYPEPTRNDTKGLYEYFNYTNYVAGYPNEPGLFFPLILLALWVIIFIAVKGYTTGKAVTITSAIISFLSIPLAILKLVAPRWMYVSFIMLAVGLMWIKLENR